MKSTTDLLADESIIFDLNSPAIALRLVVATELPPRTVRWLLSLADVLAAAIDVDRRTAMLEIADAYHRAAAACPDTGVGQDGPRIREAMLAAELRARRLAEHLPSPSDQEGDPDHGR